MGYGIKATGADDIFMVDSEDAAGCVLATLAEGPQTVADGGTANTYAAADGDILLAQPSATTTYGINNNGYGIPQNNSVTKTHVRVSNHTYGATTGNGTNAPAFVWATRYIILQAPENTGANNPNGDYGLLVYNSDGSEIVFDSRKFTRGLVIENIWEPGTLDGGWGWGSTWKSNDGNSSGTYDMTNNTIYTATGADAAAKTADMQQIFVSIIGNFGSAGTGNITNTVYYNTVYYNYDEHKIFFYAFFPGFSASGVGGQPDTPLPNNTSILVGRLKE